MKWSGTLVIAVPGRQHAEGMISGGFSARPPGGWKPERAGGPFRRLVEPTIHHHEHHPGRAGAGARGGNFLLLSP